MKKLYAFANEFAVEAPQAIEEPQSITMPIGRWLWGEKEIDGEPVQIWQALTPYGADRIAAEITKETPVPVYYGHPDVPEVAGKYPDKAAKGWIESAEFDGEALKLNVRWLEPPREGFKWFSPYWTGVFAMGDRRPGEKREGTLTVDKVISVGLVNMPNIEEFRLYNEANPVQDTQTEDNAMLKKLCESLGIPPESTEEEALAAVAKMKETAAGAESLANEAKESKEAFANERTSRICELVDRAVADKRILETAAGSWREKLAKDFDANAQALANEKPIKTKSVVGERKPENSGGAKDSLVSLANEIMVKQGIGWDRAWAQLKADRPDLFEAKK